MRSITGTDAGFHDVHHQSWGLKVALLGPILATMANFESDQFRSPFNCVGSYDGDLFRRSGANCQAPVEEPG